MTEQFAPAPGADPDFEEIIRRVTEGLESAGNPEGIDEETAREVTARAFVKHGGKTYDTSWRQNERGARNSLPDDYVDRPREYAIPDAPSEPYWYEDPGQARLIEHFVMARLKLGNRLHGGLLITGPAGSGKTGGIRRVVDRLNVEHGLSLAYLKMDCPTITDPQKWFGRREVDKNGTRYEKSTFIEAVESGGVILLDEFMRLHPSLHNPVMAFLDQSEEVLLSDLNVTVKRHPHTVFIGTTNQGAAFGGTHRMDWAMRERWSYTIERDFPPRDEEIKVLVSWNPGCDLDAASVLVDIAQKTRDMFKTGDLRTPISTRTLNNAAFLVASGWTEREALGFTALPEYDGGADGVVGQESDRTKVAQLIQGKTKAH